MSDILVWLSLLYMTHICWERSLGTQTADVTLGNPNRASAPSLAETSCTSLSFFPSSHVLLEPGPAFCPRKGSGQLQKLKTLPWRNQNQQRQPFLFPLDKARLATAPAQCLLCWGTSVPRLKGHASSFLRMLCDIQRRVLQKAPETMTDTYLSTTPCKKCEGWGRGRGRLPCARELCWLCPNQRTSPSSKAGVPNLSCILGPHLGIMFKCIKLHVSYHKEHQLS